MSKDDNKNYEPGYAIELHFPIEPSEEYLKQLTREVAHSRFDVIPGEKKTKPKLLKDT